MAVPVAIPRVISRGVTRAVSARSYGAFGGSGAASLAGGEADATVYDLSDQSILIRDTATPANNTNVRGIVLSGALTGPGSELTYSAPSLKLCLQSDGLYHYQAHNILLRSEEFDHATWVKDNSGAVSPTVTANYATAPDGTATADRVQLDKTGGVFSRIQQGVTGVVGQSYTVDVWMKSNTVSTYGVGMRLTNTSATDTNMSVTPTWAKFTLSGVCSSAAMSLDIILWDSIGGNSESADISAWGAHVRITNSNTDYIRTTSAAIYAPPYEYNSSGTCLGVKTENGATNVVLRNRDLTNAAWVKVNVTAAKTQTGIDGIANSASSITATAGNGTCQQAIVLASSARLQSAFVKRLIGSGTIEMTMDAGLTWTAIAVTSSWVRVDIPSQTLANPTVGFRIVTSGDAIAVDLVQNETNFATLSTHTSPVETFAAAVTRAIDNIYQASGFPIGTNVGTLVVSGYVDPGQDSSSANYYCSMSDGSIANLASISESGGTNFLTISASATQSNFAVGSEPTATQKIWAAHSWASNSVHGCRDGLLGTEDTSATPPASLSRLSVGVRGDGNAALCGHTSTLEYYPRKFGASELEAVTQRTGTRIVLDGNSLSVNTYQSALIALLGSSYQATHYGVGGQTTVNMSSDAATQIDVYLSAIRNFNGRAALIAWEATNDIFVDDADLATLQSRWTSYFSGRASAGWNTGNKLVTMTIIARGNFTGAQATRAADFNTWLRATYSTYATHLVDLAADARFQNSADLTYYNADTVHLSATGDSVVADLIKAAVWP